MILIKQNDDRLRLRIDEALKIKCDNTENGMAVLTGFNKSITKRWVCYGNQGRIEELIDWK